MIVSCVNDDKESLKGEPLSTQTQQRSVLDCGPDLSQTNCTSKPYYGVPVPTLLGCDAVASYSVQVCKTTSVPVKVQSIAIYNLDLNFSPNCTVLVDSIIYYLANGNPTRAAYLQNMFNRLATKYIETSVLNSELSGNKLLYSCESAALVNLEFFSSKCYKFCPIGKKQVYCGIGCCKRATGYCYDDDGILHASAASVSQSAPCQSVFDPCESGGNCSASACDVITPVFLDDGGK